MSIKSTEDLKIELKQLRKRFYISQFSVIFGFIIAFILAGLLSKYVGETASIVVFILVIVISVVFQAYYSGEHLISRCPNCNAHFYGIFKWPLMGWIVFLFFSNCKKCGLNLLGNNIKEYGGNRT